jgi:hypothetical protein
MLSKSNSRMILLTVICVDMFRCLNLNLIIDGTYRLLNVSLSKTLYLLLTLYVVLFPLSSGHSLIELRKKNHEVY